VQKAPGTSPDKSRILIPSKANIVPPAILIASFDLHILWLFYNPITYYNIMRGNTF
jgi:hypothetical protein